MKHQEERERELQTIESTTLVIATRQHFPASLIDYVSSLFGWSDRYSRSKSTFRRLQTAFAMSSAVKPKAKPSQTKPSQTKPSRAEPSQTKPSHAKPSRAEPSRAQPSCPLFSPRDGNGKDWVAEMNARLDFRRCVLAPQSPEGIADP